MQTNDPGKDRGEPMPGQAAPPPAGGDATRQRSTGEKIALALLVVVVGIPVGLFVFGALLFGACLLNL
ncbi:MAG TPA: hypothetical protein VFL14_05595 [Xanthomonadales bacterium]|nr:hypothetical protein [Xanthomonadales bacterium]